MKPFSWLCTLQEYLVLSPDKTTQPIPMLNYIFDPEEKNLWKHVKVERSLPYELGSHLLNRGFGTLLRICPSQETDLLRTALRAKVTSLHLI